MSLTLNKDCGIQFVVSRELICRWLRKQQVLTVKRVYRIIQTNLFSPLLADTRSCPRDLTTPRALSVQQHCILEKLFMRGRVSRCGTLQCYLLLRNCHSHPHLQQPHPDQSAAINMEVRPSTSKRTIIPYRLRGWLTIVSNKMF